MKRIPVKALKELAKSQGLKQAILFGWDGESQHVVTYGDTVEYCDLAAQTGHAIKKIMKWEGAKEVFPSRIKKLMKECALMKEEIKKLKDNTK